jgi:predicted GNAT family acetyltransferase
MSAAAVEPGSDVEVIDQKSARRFELRVGDDLAGLLDYRSEDDSGPVRFTHAEVYPKFEKQGLGQRLVKDALDAVIADGRKFVPDCPFVAWFVEENPSYSEHVAG